MGNQIVPFREGLFTEDGEGGALLASRCQSCGRVFFPRRDYCPDCYGEDMEAVSLRGNGKLYTFTISQMPTEHYKPPYAVGWVEFNEGVRVFGQIRDGQNKPLKIGMDVKLVIDRLWEEEDKEIIGYKFEPVA